MEFSQYDLTLLVGCIRICCIQLQAPTKQSSSEIDSKVQIHFQDPVLDVFFILLLFPMEHVMFIYWDTIESHLEFNVQHSIQNSQ